MEENGPTHRLFVGTYTQKGESGAIYLLSFTPRIGKLYAQKLGSCAPNPSFIVRSKQGLFAAHELSDRACLAAYEVSSKGNLKCRNTCEWPGEAGTCYVLENARKRILYGANYESGSIVACEISALGDLQNKLPALHEQGRGPNLKRQEGSHVHSLCLMPNNIMASVNLGSDTITLYHVKPSGGLKLRETTSIAIPPGSGPRLLAQHPRLPLVALVNELANSVWLFKIGQGGFRWEHTQTLSLPGEPSSAQAAHLAFSKDGRFLYVSVRKANCLTCFSLGDKGRALRKVSTPAQGEMPRHFSLSPTNAFIAVANQGSNHVSVFARNVCTGNLDFISSVSIPQPSCVVWDSF